MASERRTWQRLGWAIAALAAVALVAVAASRADWSAFSPEALAERVRAAGSLGPAALLGLLILQCVVAPLPSEPLMMAAGFVYGPWSGFALSLVGVTIGAVACFGLARRFGRPLAERMVRADRLDAIDAHLAGRSLPAVLLGVLALRLFAFGSFDVLSYACGLFLVPFGWFVAITAVGVVPKVFAFTYLGASAGARPGWLDALILIGTFGVLVGLPWVLRRRAAR